MTGPAKPPRYRSPEKRYRRLAWAVLLTSDDDRDGREWMARGGLFLDRAEADAHFSEEQAFADKNRSPSYTIRPSRVVAVEVRELAPRGRPARRAAEMASLTTSSAGGPRDGK